MYYLAGFYKSITAPATYSQVSAVVDQGLSIGSNGGYLLGSRMRVKAAHLLCVNGIAAQIAAPSLRNYALPEVYPIAAAATVPDSVAVMQLGPNGVLVPPNDEVSINASLGSTGATDTFGALWLTDKDAPAPGGPVVTIPCTSTLTLVKGAWVLGTLTFGTVLPVGNYAVVGMQVVGTACYLARLVFPGFSTYRPGVVCNKLYGDSPRDQYWRAGRAGLFGQFFTTQQPTIEVFGITAGAQTITVYLDVVKTGS